MYRLGNIKGSIKSTEILISLVFLGGMGFYCWKLLEKQRIAVIKANQNIEIVSIVNEMRMILGNSGSCKASFEGLPLNHDENAEDQIFSLVEASANGESNKEVHVISSQSNKKIGSQGLKLEGYFLNKPDEESDNVDLLVRFDRGLGLKKVTKKIRLFVTENNGRIVNCSLNHIKNIDVSAWEVNDENDGLYYRHYVNIGSGEHRFHAPLSINGTLQLLLLNKNCDELAPGSFYFEQRGLILCTDLGEKIIFKTGGAY